MPDATNRGGALAAVYRSIKKREDGQIRLDKQKVLAEAQKISTAKGSGRNMPMAKVMGPEKSYTKTKY